MPIKKTSVIEIIRKKSKHVNKIITQNKSKNIIAYCRVSDSKQIDNYSPEVQLAHIKRYAKQNDLKIVGKPFIVLGESSKKGSIRPSVEELIEFIDTTKHRIHSVVVFHSNRFTRDGRFGDVFLDKIISRGVGFTDLNDPQDIFNAKGRLRQIDSFYDAEHDNLNRKTFINAITLEKLKQGYTMRRPPRGYQLHKANKKSGVKQRLIITAEGKLIQQAFRLKLDYNYSNVMISEIMNPRGLKITPKALGEIFKNCYYCGIIKDSRLVEFNGYVQGIHPPMISEEEFQILNYSKEIRRQFRKNDVKELPLRKHLICSNCNTKMTGYPASKRKDLFYYKCNTRGCNVNIRNEILHDLYVEKLKSFSFNKNYLPQLKRVLDEVFKIVNKSNLDLKKVINKKITELEDERFLAIRNMNANPDQSYVLKELIDYCDEDLANLWEQLDNVKVGLNEIEKDVIKALKFINDLPTIWLESDFVFRVKLQELVFPSGIWFDKKSNKLIAPNINPIFNIVSDLYDFISKNSDKNKLESTDKYCQNNDEKTNTYRTSNVLKDMPVTPNLIGSYEHHLKVSRQGNIPLVALLSDRSNNFGNDLYDFAIELIRFVELYSIINNNIL